MKKVLTSLIAAAGLAVATPTLADTTVYTDSSSPLYPTFAPVTNAGAALGEPDGESALVPRGGFIAFQTDPFETVDLTLEVSGVTGSGNIRLYVGQTLAAGTFRALDSGIFRIENGSNNLTSSALSNYCAGLGGCNTFITQAWSNTTFALDAVVAATPEPAAWALMIFGFLGVAARLKSARGGSRGGAERLAAA